MGGSGGWVRWAVWGAALGFGGCVADPAARADPTEDRGLGADARALDGLIAVEDAAPEAGRPDGSAPDASGPHDQALPAPDAADPDLGAPDAQAAVDALPGVDGFVPVDAFADVGPDVGPDATPPDLGLDGALDGGGPVCRITVTRTDVAERSTICALADTGETCRRLAECICAFVAAPEDQEGCFWAIHGPRALPALGDYCYDGPGGARTLAELLAIPDWQGNGPVPIRLEGSPACAEVPAR